MPPSRAIAACLSALLLACAGSDSPDDPASRTFRYGPPAAPDLDQLHAAQEAEHRLSIGWQYRTNAFEYWAIEASDALPLLPDALAAFLLASPDQEPALPPGADEGPAAVAAGVYAALASPEDFDVPTCVTAVPSRVRYFACTTTSPAGWAVRVDGTFDRDGDHLSWDFTVTATLERPGFAASGRKRLHGALTVGPFDVGGRALAEVTTVGVAAGAPFEVAAVTVTDVDLDYVASDLSWCATEGTLELRRVWTARRPGAPAEGSAADQGHRFEWTGCGLVRVARSE